MKDLHKKDMFTNAEINQIESYMNHRDDEGWYFAPKDQFEKRHQSIRQKLKKMRSLLNSNKI
jgi:hypothetical protein